MAQQPLATSESRLAIALSALVLVATVPFAQALVMTILVSALTIVYLPAGLVLSSPIWVWLFEVAFHMQRFRRKALGPPRLVYPIHAVASAALAVYAWGETDLSFIGGQISVRDLARLIWPLLCGAAAVSACGASLALWQLRRISR